MELAYLPAFFKHLPKFKSCLLLPLPLHYTLKVPPTRTLFPHHLIFTLNSNVDKLILFRYKTSLDYKLNLQKDHYFNLQTSALLNHIPPIQKHADSLTNKIYLFILLLTATQQLLLLCLDMLDIINPVREGSVQVLPLLGQA